MFFYVVFFFQVSLSTGTPPDDSDLEDGFISIGEEKMDEEKPVVPIEQVGDSHCSDQL